MPKLPIFTATGTQGVNPLSAGIPRIQDPSPAAFGAEGFKGMGNLGHALLAVDEKLQFQNERLGLAEMDSDFAEMLDEISAEAIKQPDPDAAHTYLTGKAQALQETLSKRATSNAQRTAFLTHMRAQFSQSAIHVATESRKRATQQAVARYDRESDRRMERAALAPTDAEASEHLQTDWELRDDLVQKGFLSPQEALAKEESRTNRYWELVAQKNPDKILAMFAASDQPGQLPAGMDQAKMGHYVNIAVGTMTAQQFRAERALKAQEAQVRATQQQNANMITADIIEGKPGATDNIPALLRSRQLDDGVGRTLVELHQRMSTAPDMTRYQSGLAAQIEASLSAMKYSPDALQDGLEQGLVSDFTEGRILKAEFTHLMGVFREVENHKQQAGKETANREVNHAHDNLVGRLRTTGPADKFDALSEQTVKEAEQFFYRRMTQQPNADPWAVMSEAEKIFKPVIEKRLGVTSADKQALDDAKMKALRASGAISAAGYKAWQDGKNEANAGRAIVEETLKGLQPPPQPGFLERLNPFGKKGEQPKAAPKERKKPGFFGDN